MIYTVAEIDERVAREQTYFRRLGRDFTVTTSPPASEAALAKAEGELGVTFPSTFRSFLKTTDGLWVQWCEPDADSSVPLREFFGLHSAEMLIRATRAQRELIDYCLNSGQPSRAVDTVLVVKGRHRLDRTRGRT